MIVRLLPNQVPQLWDAIKFSAVHANRIEEKDIPVYLNRLLSSLLNDKAQCFIRISNTRLLQAVIITNFMLDEINGDKSLAISCLYSFEPVDETQWIVSRDYIAKFARANGCKTLLFYSSNNRVFELASSLGFTERFRSFHMEV